MWGAGRFLISIKRLSLVRTGLEAIDDLNRELVRACEEAVYTSLRSEGWEGISTK